MEIKRKINKRLWAIRCKINKRKYPDLAGLNSGITILSQNCVGGVLMKELNMVFSSPTVNVYFSMPDFIKFCKNIQEYCSYEIVEDKDESIKHGYPVCRIGDIVVHCVHYESYECFVEKWNLRKSRMTDNIFLIMTDRDGFTKEMLPEISKIPYEKVLFSNKEYPGYDFVVKVKGFNECEEVGNLSEYYGLTGIRLFDKYYDFPSKFRSIDWKKT